jgi:hypothetical protein
LRSNSIRDEAKAVRATQALICSFVLFACAACAQSPAPETTAAIVTPTPTTVVVVEKPVVVEKKVIVEKPTPIVLERKVIVTKPVVVEKRVPVYVEKGTLSKASGSRCHYVRPYTRKDGTKVSGHTRCRRS